MRYSEFMRLMDGEFGEQYASTVVRSHSLWELDGRTAEQAIADGVAPRRVWEAICVAFDVPPERQLGEDRPIVNHPFE